MQARWLVLAAITLSCTSCSGGGNSKTTLVPLSSMILSSLSQINTVMDENAKHPAGAKVEATYYPCTITASYTVTLKDVSKIEEDASAVLPLYVPITIGVKNTDEQDVSNANQIKVDFKTASCGAKDKGDTPIRVRSAVAAAVAELRPNLPIPQKLILENKILENLSIKDHL